MREAFPPPPTPEELDALVAREREIVAEIASLMQLLQPHKLVGVVDTHEEVAVCAGPPRHPLPPRGQNSSPRPRSGGEVTGPQDSKSMNMLGLASDHATTPPPCHPECEFCELEGSQPWLQRQLVALSPSSHPLATYLIQQAAAGRPSTLEEDQLHTHLQDTSFPHWLHYVVKGLVPKAQTPVIRELWSHYWSELSEPFDCAAHRFALERLGERTQVAKALEAVHATREEFLLFERRFWLAGFAIWCVCFAVGVSTSMLAIGIVPSAMIPLFLMTHVIPQAILLSSTCWYLMYKARFAGRLYGPMMLLFYLLGLQFEPSLQGSNFPMLCMISVVATMSWHWRMYSMYKRKSLLSTGTAAHD